MSDPLDKIFEEPGIIEEQHRRPRKKRIPGGFLNLLSGIFVAGTIVVGLLFASIFTNPQSSLNPLPPATMTALFLIYTPSSTPKPVSPPAWTQTISPTDTPTLTPIPTDTPIPIVENSPTPEADMADADCNLLGDEGQISDMDDLADSISDVFTPEIQYWEDEILAWGKGYGLDPNLITTVLQLESCGYARALSAAGAKGLFQVMPQYFEEEENPYDPDTNAYRGLSWLKRSLIFGGTTKMALAGYNAGFTRVNNPYLEWPNETQRYVDWGLGIYQDATCGYDSSSSLDHWLSKGGAALCSRAAAEQQDK